MAKRKSRTVRVRVARSAISGRFVTKRYAQRNPRTTVVETVRRPRK